MCTRLAYFAHSLRRREASNDGGTSGSFESAGLSLEVKAPHSAASRTVLHITLRALPRVTTTSFPRSYRIKGAPEEESFASIAALVLHYATTQHGLMGQKLAILDPDRLQAQIASDDGRSSRTGAGQTDTGPRTLSSGNLDLDTLRRSKAATEHRLEQEEVGDNAGLGFYGGCAAALYCWPECAAAAAKTATTFAAAVLPSTFPSRSSTFFFASIASSSFSSLLGSAQRAHCGASPRAERT